MKNKFDLEKFLDSLDSDNFSPHEAIAENPKLSDRKKITKCPRCNAKKWLFMRYNTKGQAMFCSECNNVTSQ